jgi:hypothetical protein
VLVHILGLSGADDVVANGHLDHIPPVCLNKRTRELAIDCELVPRTAVRSQAVVSDSEVIPSNDARAENCTSAIALECRQPPWCCVLFVAKP